MRQAGGKSFQGEGDYFLGEEICLPGTLLVPPFVEGQLNSSPKNKAHQPKTARAPIWVPGIYDIHRKRPVVFATVNSQVVSSPKFTQFLLRSKWLGSCVAAEECGAGGRDWGESQRLWDDRWMMVMNFEKPEKNI